MKFNKLMAKTLAFALALGGLSFVGMSKIKAVAAVTVSFDGTKGKITSADGKFWGVAKQLKSAPKKDKEKFLNVSDKWYQVKDVAPVVGKEIDLEKFKNKNVLIAVGSAEAFQSPAEWKIVDIKMGDKKFKAFYSLEELKAGKKVTKAEDTFGGKFGYISFFSDKAQLTAANVANVEVKTFLGDWQSVNTYFGAINDDSFGKKLSVLAQRGAKLSFRLKGNTEKWSSQEAKLVIPSQKKGPNVKADIVKETVNVKKDYLVGIALAGAEMPALNAAGDKKTFAELGIKLTDSEDNLGKAQILYVQEPKGKKLASKVSALKLVRQNAPTRVNLSENKLSGQGGDLIENKVSFNLAVDYDVNKGAYVVNKDTEKDYEFYIDYAGDQGAAVKKWIKLKKASSSDKPTKVKVAFSSTKKNNAFAAENSKIYIRYPGVKQTGNEVILPSNFIEAIIDVKNVAQTVGFEVQQADPVAVSGDGNSKATLHSVPVATEKSYSFKIAATGLVKKDGKPKVKIDKLDGIKVTIGSFDGGMKSDVTVVLTNKAFPKETDIAAKKVKITLNYEGIKDKVLELLFSKDAKG